MAACLKAAVSSARKIQITNLLMRHFLVQGQVCANPCPPGSYGLECKERCDCYNGALCDHVNGQCHCLPGFQGQKVNFNRWLWPSLFQKFALAHLS